MGAPMATSQDFVNWVCGPKLDPLYLKFVLQADRDALLRFANGSTHQTIYFPEVKAFHALLPPIEEQRGIAATLGALDDKVESNRRAIDVGSQLLSALARRSLERAGSDRIPLRELASITKGVSYRSADLVPSRIALVTLKSFDRNGGYKRDGLKPYAGKYKPDQVIRPGEVAVAQTDLTQGAEVVGRVVRVPADASADTLVASLDLAVVRPNGRLTPEYLWAMLADERFREHCRARTSGTTVLHLARDAIPEYLAPVPSSDEIRTFTELAEPLLAGVDTLSDQSVRLSTLRDALLPELLSGRIRVPEARDAAAEATA